jgi:hypothetical protein
VNSIFQQGVFLMIAKVDPRHAIIGESVNLLSTQLGFDSMRKCPRIVVFSGLGLLAITLLSSLPAMQNPATGSESGATEKQLRHVVMFGFKESSSESDVQGVIDAFVALPAKIPAIADFEYGKNNSPENLNDGLTHCFLVTFDSEADREAYLPHPAHKAFVEVLKPHLEKVVVIDYWAK